MAVLVLLAGAGGLLTAACGGGGTQETTPVPETTQTPTAPATATPDSGLSPSPTVRAIAPPLEGPSRGAAATERTNYRELPEFQLPVPEDLPAPPEGATGPEFQPPAEPQCPEDWQELVRPAEGFKICYPEGWSIEGHGYVSSGAEDRWYSLGLFLFEDAAELAHVSIYVVNPYAKPITYTRDCDQAYRVTFARETAVLCPDYAGEFPEAKIIAYHVRKGDLDYYVNVVPQFQYDAASQIYLDTWSQDAEQTGIRIAHTFQFMEIATP
jgi:hypothetical protein